MKNALIVAVLLFVLTGTAVLRAADVSVVTEKSGNDLVEYLTNLAEDGWVDLLNSLDEPGNSGLQVKALVAGQTAINAMDKDAAASLAARIENDVPSVTVGTKLDGTYVLFLNQPVIGADFNDQIYNPYFLQSNRLSAPAARKASMY